MAQRRARSGSRGERDQDLERLVPNTFKLERPADDVCKLASRVKSRDDC